MKNCFTKYYYPPNRRSLKVYAATLITALSVLFGANAGESKLPRIHLSKDGSQFVAGNSERKFTVWGFNYDHDDSGRLLEDYWYREWAKVVQDFREMKELGANVVRIHLQLGKFMIAPDKPNSEALKQLSRLVKLAEVTGLYLNITGLGCYHKKDVPKWYDKMTEQERWQVQATFWEAVAGTCANSDAIFCYDLMNEPVLPGDKEKCTEWLTDAFDGKYFIQRISLDLAERSREKVATAWVRKLVSAIRRYDSRHMITIGVIPWAYTFPKARPLFYTSATNRYLDFTSIHLYPEKNKIAKAVEVISVYKTGKPILLEEVSPLYCGINEFDTFIEKTRSSVDGYIGFYWGKTLREYRRDKTIASGIMAEWLEYFRRKGPDIIGCSVKKTPPN